MGDVALSALTSAAVSGAIVWFLRTWIGENIKNAVKHEYDVKLAGYQGSLKSEFDKELEIVKARLKAESDAATEKLKAELVRTNSEHQVRFSRMHERVAETVAETYSLLYRVHSSVIAYTNPAEFSTDPSKAERRGKVSEAVTALRTYFWPRRIFFPRAIAEKIDRLQADCFSITMQFMGGVEAEDNTRREGLKTWGEVLKRLENEVKPLMNELVDEFQQLLGVPRE